MNPWEWGVLPKKTRLLNFDSFPNGILNISIIVFRIEYDLNIEIDNLIHKCVWNLKQDLLKRKWQKCVEFRFEWMIFKKMNLMWCQ